jgi:hypothetical protein
MFSLIAVVLSLVYDLLNDFYQFSVGSLVGIDPSKAVVQLEGDKERGVR